MTMFGSSYDNYCNRGGGVGGVGTNMPHGHHPLGGPVGMVLQGGGGGVGGVGSMGGGMGLGNPFMKKPFKMDPKGKANLGARREKPMTSVSAIIEESTKKLWEPGGLLVDNAMTMSSVGPNSPLEIQSDGNSMMSSPNFSPRNGGDSNSPNMPQTSFTIGHSGYGGSGSVRAPQYPPNHPLSGSKHLCSICGDRASGKHYGVYSCEGCKGFFKRTVRKDLVYACREDRNCIIDKRQRNRCQYCRYQKCLSMGMKREAVQEERQRTKEKNENEVESTSNMHSDMSLEKILDAELRSDIKHPTLDSAKDSVFNICQVADKQLLHLVEWAKHIPHFMELPISDQVVLLRAGWNELLIASFSHRSTDYPDSIALATGLVIHRSQANGAGVGSIFDRVLTELVAKMREMKMDRTELGCLRAIVLFNPEAKGLISLHQVEMLREKVYAALEEHCKNTYVDEQGRFAKLLLRLPALRSIGLKCLEHLFFFKLIGDTPIDTFLLEMLEAPCDP